MRTTSVHAVILGAALCAFTSPSVLDAAESTNSATFLLPVVRAVFSGRCPVENTDKQSRRWIEMGVERMGEYLRRIHTNTLYVVFKSTLEQEDCYFAFNAQSSNLTSVAAHTNGARALWIYNWSTPADKNRGLRIRYGLQELILQVNMDEPEATRIKAVGHTLYD